MWNTRVLVNQFALEALPVDTCSVQYVSRFFSLVWRLWLCLTPPVSCASVVQKAFPPVHEPNRGSKPLRLISLALLLFTLLTYLLLLLLTPFSYILFVSRAERTKGKNAHHFALIIIGLSSVIVWKKHVYNVFLDLIAVYFDNVTSW